MPRRTTDFPEEGEFVVGSVKEVKDYGAFVELEEYPGKEGFIHISEVASGWVKYVRDHVRENQKLVCKVTSIDRSKGHVDLSLKRVNEHQKREKLQEWKNEQKAEKLLELLSEEIDIELDEIYDEIGYDLVEAFGGLYPAFEETAIDGSVLDDVEMPDGWRDAFVEIADENISIPYVTIKGYLDVSCPTPAGVDVIKEALVEAEQVGDGEIEVDVQYLGAPHYRISVNAPDYKAAEEEMRNAADRARQVVEAGGGTCTFDRQRED